MDTAFDYDPPPFIPKAPVKQRERPIIALSTCAFGKPFQNFFDLFGENGEHITMFLQHCVNQMDTLSDSGRLHSGVALRKLKCGESSKYAYASMARSCLLQLKRVLVAKNAFTFEEVDTIAFPSEEKDVRPELFQSTAFTLQICKSISKTFQSATSVRSIFEELRKTKIIGTHEERWRKGTSFLARIIL